MAEKVVPLTDECLRIRRLHNIVCTWADLLRLATQNSCVKGLEPLICASCTALCPNKSADLETTHRKSQYEEALKILEKPGLLI